MNTHDSLTQSTSLSPFPSDQELPTRYRPTWAEISVGAFAQNVRSFKSLVGANTQVMAVLKADAYGHGALALAPVAEKNGASFIGISSLEEGISLRKAGIQTPILLLGGLFPLENFSVAFQWKLIPTVASLDGARHLSQLAQENKQPLPFHLEVDTGMGRLGVSAQAAVGVLEFIASQKRLNLAGVYSHFSTADGDVEFMNRQLEDFLGLQKTVQSMGFKNVLFHMANSAASLRNPQSRLNMIRPGISLYGPNQVDLPPGMSLKPVLSWHTKIVFMKRISKGSSVSYSRKFIATKDTEVATLPVGYADGVPRSISGKGHVLIKGQRCPILGVVTMDQIMVDITDLKADVGDDVILIGRQNKEEISVSEWAAWAGTIPYEILCGISKRVPREVVA